MRYVKRWDDEPFEVRSHEITRWSCCDCGLVHDIAFVARGKVIEVAARVNRRATAAKRRHKATPSPMAALGPSTPGNSGTPTNTSTHTGDQPL